jgi:hypothetical protein
MYSNHTRVSMDFGEKTCGKLILRCMKCGTKPPYAVLNCCSNFIHQVKDL